MTGRSHLSGSVTADWAGPAGCEGARGDLLPVVRVGNLLVEAAVPDVPEAEARVKVAARAAAKGMGGQAVGDGKNFSCQLRCCRLARKLNSKCRANTSRPPPDRPHISNFERDSEPDVDSDSRRSCEAHAAGDGDVVAAGRAGLLLLEVPRVGVPDPDRAVVGPGHLKK